MLVGIAAVLLGWGAYKLYSRRKWKNIERNRGK